MSLFEDFLHTAREKALFPPDARRVLVACSGGMDSVFLLHLLWAVRQKLDLDLCVVTCDHGLRPESLADAEWVRHLAWSMGLPCHFLALDVSNNTRKGESTEMAARRLRLEAFVALARETGAGALVLGHHQDDQAETVLMRLCRGTGTRGAAGMNWVSAWGGLRVVRPLLGMPQTEIARVMCRWGRSWREDDSNADERFRRNRVRHEILPMLETRLNVKATAHLAAFAEQQRELEAWAASRARVEYGKCVQEGQLQISKWRKRPKVLRKRILLSFLRQSGVGISQLTSKRLMDLHDALLQNVTEGRAWFFEGCTLLQEHERLVRKGETTLVAEMGLNVPGKIFWDPLGRTLSARIVDGIDPALSAKAEWGGTLTGFIRLPEVAGIQVRGARVGDRYRQLGMSGRTKLSDLFINAKVPKRLRANWPVVVFGEEIVWVPGFRVAEAWRVSNGPSAERCVQLTLES